MLLSAFAAALLEPPEQHVGRESEREARAHPAIRTPPARGADLMLVFFAFNLTKHNIAERRSLLEDLLRITPWLHLEVLAPVLLQDDFSHHNVGFAEDGKRVVGAFDFTQARIGDPHRDLRYAFTTEPFAESMIREYERNRGVRLDRNRVRAWHAWSALCFLAWELHHGDPERLPMRWAWVDHVAAWSRVS